MKVGIIGAGFVGAACAKSMLLRGSCHEIVIHDIETKEITDPKTGKKRIIRKDQGLATDLSHAELLCPHTCVRHGDYKEMKDAAVIVITAGINEQQGKAIDRDGGGRMLLLEDNAKTYHEIMDEMDGKVPLDIPILVVTDPPDPLAKIAQDRRPKSPVISTGTYLDSLRFQLQIANWLSRDPSSGEVIPDRIISSRNVDAIVIGEHGTSQVYVWSSAQIDGKPVLDMAEEYGWDRTKFREKVVDRVMYANIDIIEGTGASQHGIGVVTARIVEAILHDEGLVAPVGVFQKSRFETTLSLPSVIGRQGVTKVLSPALSVEEDEALEASADAIKAALNSLPSES